MSSLLTKDEILEQADVVWCPEVEIQRSDVHEAMDIYAKQECIAFAEWVVKEQGYRNIGGDDWENDSDIEVIRTTEQLYELHLLSIKQG